MGVGSTETGAGAQLPLEVEGASGPKERVWPLEAGKGNGLSPLRYLHQGCSSVKPASDPPPPPPELCKRMDLCFSSRGVGDNLPRRPQEINTLPYWSPRPQGICNSLNISKAPSELSLTSKNTPHQPSRVTTAPKPSAPPPRSGQEPRAWGRAGEGSSGCSGHARLGTGHAGAPSVGRARRWSSREGSKP